MSQPVYLPKIVTTVDGYVDPNLSVIKQVSTKRNAFGGIVIEQSILSNSSGGSVSVAQGTGADSAKSYNTNDAIIPNMALVFNSFGGTVTPNFSDAILSPQNQTNFVGVAKTTTQVNDHNWVQLNTQISTPAPRMFHAMVYIPSSQQHLVHGGLAPNNFLFGDTSLWNGSSWQNFTGGEPSNGRFGHAATCDTIHHSNATSQNLVLIFGGANSVSGLLAETWYYDGQGWAEIFPGTSPSARVHSAMTFHVDSGLTVLFGGFVGSNTLSNETWTLDVTSPQWTLQSPANAPGVRMNHSMAYDPIRKRAVLFGGTDGYNMFNDTWEWDGTNWTLVQFPTIIPPARMNASMTYDPVSKVIVLFGGYSDAALSSNKSFNIFSDVWYYDGVTWTQQLFFGPSARAGAAITFDKTKNCVFLFGGGNGGTPNSIHDLEFSNPATTVFSDTWELLTLTSQVDIQTSGDTYVYWDATGLLAIAPGAVSRASDGTTVTVSSSLPHNFNIGDKFAINSPGDVNFAAGFYVVTASLDDNHFTYTSSGSVAVSTSAIVIETVIQTSTIVATEIPAIKRFLGPGGIPGTVTTNGLGNTSDGLSPIFGIVAESPLLDSSGALFQTLIGTDRVGLVKMHIGAFYGFIAGISPQIRFFSPVSGPTGTEFVVVGDGLNTTTAVTFFSNSSAPLTAQFKVSSASEISATVPTGAQTLGGMRLTTSIGSIAPSGFFKIIPKIYSVTAATHAIGQQITLIGTTFTPAAGSLGVSLPGPGGAPSSLSFAGTSGNITLPFQTTIASGSNGQSLPQATIHVSSVTNFPTAGTIYVTTTDGYESVTYTGTSGGNAFTGCSGGTGAMTTGNLVLYTFTVIDDQTIHVNIPTGAITGDIVLTTPDGVTTYQNFPVLAPPTISLITPSTGASGSALAVTGTGFLTAGSELDGYGTLTFVQGGQTLSAQRTIFNDTTMTAVIPSLPSGQLSTAFNLHFSNNAGTTVSSQQYTIVSKPKFLTSASTTLTSTINSSVATIGVGSATTFPSSGNFFIESEQISYTGKTTNSFTGCTRGINGTTAASHTSTTAVNVLTFISQSNDSYGVGGVEVRIFGDYGFTGVSSVSFASFEATSFNFVNDGYITAIVPSVVSSDNVAGAITVISTGGISNTGSSDGYYTAPHNFTILQGPTVTSISNPSNLVGAQSGKTGDAVFITGTNFLGVTSVEFDGMSATASFTIVSSTQINVTVPNSSSGIVVAPSNGPITVAKSTFFSVNSGQNFTYYPAPASLAISSPAADSGGDNFDANGGNGTAVTLSGTNMTQGGSPYPQITFGGVSATIGSASPTSISTTVPINAGNGVVLTTAGGTASIAFNVLKPVTITGLNTDWPYNSGGRYYATPFYPSNIYLFGTNFRDSSHMTISIIDPSQGNASINIPTFTFHNSTSVQFTAANLGPFANYDTCYVKVTTFFPGGSYSAQIYGLTIFFPIT